MRSSSFSCPCKIRMLFRDLRSSRKRHCDRSSSAKEDMRNVRWMSNNKTGLQSITNFDHQRRTRKLSTKEDTSLEKEIYDSYLPFFGDEYKLRILLVRHGESIGNADKSVLKKSADHSIQLSREGFHQAEQVAEIIRGFYANNPHPTGLSATSSKCHRRLWCSPYTRARQTAEVIMKTAAGTISDMREHILLGEQQFGLFEGHSLEDLKLLYPQEYAHFTKCIESGGRFWARMPLGESRFDVAKRIHQAFGSFHRDAQFHKINDLIIVSHGVALRAFAMMWLHHSPEWFEQEPNPRMCSIRLIDDNQDKGYLFPGFKSEVWDPEQETFQDY